MSDSYNKIVKEMVEVVSLMYHLGWDERMQEIFLI